MLLFKVIILGDAAVGKTSMMNNYLGNPFTENDPPTIGVEFASKTSDMTQIIREELLKRYRETFESKHGRQNIYNHVKLQIWNSSGQERFRSIVNSYYRNTRGVILVCDLTRKQTLENLKYWINDYNRYGSYTLDQVGAIIVGTKSDLMDHREVYDSDLRELAEQYNLPFFTISSKLDRDKVDRCFNNIINQMLEKYIDNPPEDIHSILKLERSSPSSKSCCLVL